MASISRRVFVGSLACGPASLLATSCGHATSECDCGATERSSKSSVNPYQFGAIGDGKNDDTQCFRAAYAAALKTHTTLDVPSGRYYVPGHIEIESPGVSIVGSGGAVIGGGELRVGPTNYGSEMGGVDFSGDRITGVIFDQDDEFGTSRCLVLRNVRGLDISQNYFRRAGKGISVERGDGNEKFHTTAMVRISDNRFSSLTFGVFGDTAEWDRLSDWQITDNYFNYCSDSSVWIASTDSENVGGIDGLNFAGNTIFSMAFTLSSSPIFGRKRYNLRLGQSNWLRILDNSFFEAGLSAVYIDHPQNFEIIGNHFGWPGQREYSDCLEIHNGSPAGSIESNTFSRWTRAAIGLYDLTSARTVIVGQNNWDWVPNPSSWKGEGAVDIDDCSRIMLAGDSAADGGYPVIRDFESPKGLRDSLRGSNRLHSRDRKSLEGGTSGASTGDIEISGSRTVFAVSDFDGGSSPFGGLVSITATSVAEPSQSATYVLILQGDGTNMRFVKEIASAGPVDGTSPSGPSFSWSISNNELIVTPVGSTGGFFRFDACSVGSVCFM